MLPELLVGFDDHKDPYAIIWFPGGLDKSEEPFTGVKFTRLEEELIINEREFLKLVHEASLAFTKMYPDRVAEIAPMLGEVEKRLAK